VVLQGNFNSNSGQNAHAQGENEDLSFTVIGDLQKNGRISGDFMKTGHKRTENLR
jgi:hypothetical protein